MVIVPPRTRAPHRVYLVRPVGDFTPRNWQSKPNRFQIIKRLETTPRIGRADSLCWLQNQKALESGSLDVWAVILPCLLYTSPSPRDRTRSRMPSSA